MLSFIRNQSFLNRVFKLKLVGLDLGLVILYKETEEMKIIFLNLSLKRLIPISISYKTKNLMIDLKLNIKLKIIVYFKLTK